MKTLFVLLIAGLISVNILAQEAVDGIVSDSQGTPVAGAKVYVKGALQGGFTDEQGAFSLAAPKGSNILIVSALGFVKQEVSITGEPLSISLDKSPIQLDEVAITALGIEKGKRSLGYGVSTMRSDQMEGRAEADISRILRGKATGVDILQASGITGSSTSIIIRGYSSITGENQPLFVVDGVPIHSTTNMDHDYRGGGATASSRFLDLDPNNVAEVSILKGLSATVLYGEAGKNGVIMIATKHARAGENMSQGNKKIEINLNQQLGFTEIANMPEYQNNYGNGFSGNFGWFFSTWGPRFQAPGGDRQRVFHPYDQEQYYDDFPEFIGAFYQYQPYESVENFFNKGLHQTTSLSLESQINSSTSVRANYSYLNDEGFLPERENGYIKHNFGIGLRTQLSSGPKISASFNKLSSERNAPLAAASKSEYPRGGETPNLFGYLFITPRSIDLMNLPFESPIDGSMVYYRRGLPVENPRWTAKHTQDREDISRYFGNINVGYDLTKSLSLSYRIGMDQYQQSNIRTINKGGSVYPNGLIMTSERQHTILDQVANLHFAFALTKNLELSGNMGANLTRNTFKLGRVRSRGQFIFDNFTHANFQMHTSDSYDTDRNIAGVYLSSQLGYKDFLYLNMQGRNEWFSSSDDPKGTRFFPAVSLSFIPTEVFTVLQNSSKINFINMRLAYGSSASHYRSFQNSQLASPISNASEASSSNTSGRFSLNNITGTQDLRPETTSEIEAGISAGFLGNRVGVDISVYSRNSQDLIIAQDVFADSMYNRNFVNAASVENKGIEAGIHLVPLKGKLAWTLDANVTVNRNKVIDIASGIDQVLIAGSENRGNFAVPGEFFGVIQGFPYQRSMTGDLLIADSGFFRYAYIADTTIAPIGPNGGNPNPNYVANLFSSISYKGFTLSGQLTYVDGGDIFSRHAVNLLAHGNTVDTDVDRAIPIILPGVLASDPSQANNFQDFIGNVFYRNYRNSDEAKVFDGTSLRLREVSLAYELPAKWMEKSPLSSISLIASGENLWFKAFNFPQGLNYDPDVSSFGAGNGRGFDLSTGPTVRRYSMTLRISF